MSSEKVSLSDYFANPTALNRKMSQPQSDNHYSETHGKDLNPGTCQK